MPWLLDEEAPAVRHLALRLLMDEPEDAPVVRRARSKAMKAPPISTILENQDPLGYWDKPGAGYGRKYTGTVWSLIFLDQMGANPRDRRISRACEYVLEHAQTSSGGFGASGSPAERPPGPSAVYHCLNGNLLRSLIDFGRLDDERVRRAVEWQARSITGEGFDGYFRSGTTGPGFGCAANWAEPCAWGAIKALRGLGAIPPRRRAPYVRRAIETGIRFLLSRDPAVADYPTATSVSSSWFRLGFPSGYVADVLQNLESLADLGRARDHRLDHALAWLVSQQDDEGRWTNRYSYRGKLWSDVDEPGAPSRWVTLRACYVLKHAIGSRRLELIGSPR